MLFPPFDSIATQTGKMVLPSGTILEGEFAEELVKGKRTYTNGTIEGNWGLSCDEKAEVFRYVSLEEGKLTLDGKVISLAKIDCQGRFESPYPLDQPVHGECGPVLIDVVVDGVVKHIFCDNRNNKMEVRDKKI